MIAYLKTADAAAWTALYQAHLAEQVLGVWQPRAGVQVDVIGTIYHEGTPVPGYHVNVVADSLPAALYPYLVNPTAPKRVFFGAQVLSVPETLPELDTEVVMVERGVGVTVGDAVLVPIAIERETARLAAETLQARRDLRAANIALLQARSARAALVAARDAQVVIRDDAIARLTTLVGAARAPEVARRDAATAEIQRLVPLVTSANDALTAARSTRDALKAAP